MQIRKSVQEFCTVLLPSLWHLAINIFYTASWSQRGEFVSLCTVYLHMSEYQYILLPVLQTIPKLYFPMQLIVCPEGTKDAVQNRKNKFFTVSRDIALLDCLGQTLQQVKASHVGKKIMVPE